MSVHFDCVSENRFKIVERSSLASQNISDLRSSNRTAHSNLLPDELERL